MAKTKVTVEKESRRRPEKGNKRNMWLRTSAKDEKVRKSEEKELRIRRTSKGTTRHRE
jgi:hypothetical protein